MRTTSSRGSTGLLIIIVFAALIVIGGLLFSTGREEQPVAEETPAEPVVATDDRKINIALQSLGDSLQMGEAVLRDFEGKTSITAVISSFVSDAEQPIQISSGTCTNPGELLYSLSTLKQNDTTGTVGTDLGVSDTILDVSLDDLLAKGPLAISVRKTPEEANVSVACGEITVPAPVDGTATTTPDTVATTTEEMKTPEVQ